MIPDSAPVAAVLFAACVGGWVLAGRQRAAWRSYVRFAAILLSSLAVCAVLGLGAVAALFLLPLAAGALTVASLARFVRRLPDLLASLLLAALLAIGLGAALTGWAMLALAPTVFCAVLMGVLALAAGAPLAALGAGALLASALACLEPGAERGVLLFLAAAIVGLSRPSLPRSASPVDPRTAGGRGAAVGGLR